MCKVAWAEIVGKLCLSRTAGEPWAHWRAMKPPAAKTTKSKRKEKTLSCLEQTGEGFSLRLELLVFGMEANCFVDPVA